MLILKTPKTLRKHLRTNIKRTNQKRVKLDRIVLKEYNEELSKC